MLMALEQAAGAIRTTAESLARVSEGITKSAYLDVEALNDDLEALTKVNTALRQASTGGTAKAAIEDERDRLIDAIAERSRSEEHTSELQSLMRNSYAVC